LLFYYIFHFHYFNRYIFLLELTQFKLFFAKFKIDFGDIHYKVKVKVISMFTISGRFPFKGVGTRYEYLLINVKIKSVLFVSELMVFNSLTFCWSIKYTTFSVLLQNNLLLLFLTRNVECFSNFSNINLLHRSKKLYTYKAEQE
jgi:hypothetical protein